MSPLASTAASAAGRSGRNVERNRTSFDEHAFHGGLFVKEIAVGDDDVCDFAFLDRPEAICDARDGGRIDGEGANGGVLRESGLDCLRGVSDEVLWIRKA